MFRKHRNFSVFVADNQALFNQVSEQHPHVEHGAVRAQLSADARVVETCDACEPGAFEHWFVWIAFQKPLSALFFGDSEEFVDGFVWGC